MVEIPLLFVGKLANNLLLASFPASISEISPDFSFATDSCKGLTMDIHNIINDFINMSSPIEKKLINQVGSAMADGINFQAAVSTIVSIAVARGTKLHWLPNNDIPIEWSAETGGSGDDIQVRFNDSAVVEVCLLVLFMSLLNWQVVWRFLVESKLLILL